MKFHSQHIIDVRLVVEVFRTKKGEIFSQQSQQSTSDKIRLTMKFLLSSRAIGWVEINIKFYMKLRSAL